MPKLNFENAITWTWAIVSVLVVGIYLGLMFGESGAIEGTFFDLISTLTSLGILAIGYQGLHSWRVQDRTKMRREYAQKAIGHLTRALEVKGQFTVPFEAQKKINEAYHLLKTRDIDDEINELIIDAIQEAQSQIENAVREVPELIYSAKSAVICVSKEIYAALERINEPLRYYRVKTRTQISNDVPEFMYDLTNNRVQGGGAFYFLYDYIDLASLNLQFREIENIIDLLLDVIEHGELSNDTRGQSGD
ncbi:hypothetical protein DFP83_1382 [Idiomarina fontislapidosi]|uniref:Uncharacterized protein n=1 Tax=Idiomarina fontislapidosi TaxID=263723 RepID=A0A432XDQ9_9GAMM|nr:hypothetical protein [Idiomarina fontislapidosi]PYE29955.1 hypothetical protein DFP83_1382 [Idiomarina fontislapidosi]RUO46782.1 hypothetical protein CWE25_13470 [Idiomarina fontislapidosi]